MNASGNDAVVVFANLVSDAIYPVFFLAQRNRLVGPGTVDTYM